MEPDILTRLPHRPPMLMVDRILTLGDDGCRALKQISWSEPCFQGHFPGQPVFPGVLMIEALAQTCAVWMHGLGKEGLPIFAGIESARFLRKVLPGDTLELQAAPVKENKGFYTFQTTASVAEETVCQAQLVICLRKG